MILNITRAALCIALAAAAFAQPQPGGGKGKLYVSGRPGRIFIIDEATEKVTGEFRTPTGTPYSLSLSKDKKHAYWVSENMEDISIADLAGARVLDTFRLSEGNKKVRVRGMEPDPTENFMVLTARSYTKLIDHWEIGANEILLYDLKQHKVARKIPWPNNEEREFAGFKYSPDGKLLYIFGDDIVVYDTKDFKEVDKWELSKPIEDGFGRINFGGLDDTYEDPGYFTGIFNVQDAVQNRRLMGIARVNLQQKQVDFYALGPATGVSFTMAPNREVGYGLHQEIGKYEFWTFDLKNKRLLSRTEFPGRPRMNVKASSNGKLLYIFTAGRTIDVYEAATYKYLRTIELDADMSGLLLVAAP